MKNDDVVLNSKLPFFFFPRRIIILEQIIFVMNDIIINGWGNKTI